MTTTTKTATTMQVPSALLDIANHIMAIYVEDLDWSTFHIWDYYTSTASPDVYKSFPPNSHFGTCVDAAFSIANDFRYALEESEDPKLRKYSECIKTLASWDGLDEDGHAIPTHAMCAMMTPGYALVLDPSYHFAPFVVPLNGHFDPMDYLDMSGNVYYGRHRYVPASDDSDSEMPVLTMQLCDNSPGCEGTTYETDEYEEIDYETAVTAINFRLAKEMDKTGFPTKKHLTVTQKYPTKPLRLPAVELDGAWWATSCWLGINFMKAKLTMQVPNADFLQKPEHRELLEELWSLGILYPGSDRVAILIFKVKSEKPEDVQAKVEAGRKVGALLGLDEEVYQRVIDALRTTRARPCRPAEKRKREDSPHDEESDTSNSKKKQLVHAMSLLSLLG